MSDFDYDKVKDIRLPLEGEEKGEYEKQIKSLEESGFSKKSIEEIEKVVSEASSGLQNNEKKSFVIYGEPQSGKTQLMICLSAKLIDDGFDFVFILVNDSIQLINQNLSRFRDSDINPTPKSFSEVIDRDKDLLNSKWIVFCKKNKNNLEELVKKIEKYKDKRIVVIDDEADYATPDNNINKKEKGPTKINELTGKLIGENGVYIGVTATPARLDLNRTHENINEHWIEFKPHEKYVGADLFFPAKFDKNELKYRLTTLPDDTDDPKYLRNAVFRFMVTASYLKLNGDEKKYSMLIHTSGKVVMHTEDHLNLEKILTSLRNTSDKKHKKFLEEIFETAKILYSTDDAYKITKYILKYSSSNSIIIMNSNKKFELGENEDATNPKGKFTFIIGGNIVSRGVTFNNLLTMFFTRDAHTLGQDTYIQRARMFGVRGDYINSFELIIPEKLYNDWRKIFIFHRLSLDSRRENGIPPVWLSNKRIRVTSVSSVDKSSVEMHKGEMSFAIFEYDSIKNDILNIFNSESHFKIKLEELYSKLGKEAFPKYLINFILESTEGDNSEVVFLDASTIEGMGDADKENISRSRNTMGQYKKYEEKGAKHLITIRYNDEGKARVIYRYIGSIKFQKILKQ